MKSISNASTTATPKGQERYEPAGGFSQEDLEAFFAQQFGQAGRRSDWGATGRPRPGRDMQYSLTVSFVDAAGGTTRRLALPDGKTLDVRIPPGTEDGHILRLRGQGGPGFNGAPAGDALIEITVAPIRASTATATTSSPTCRSR